MSRQRPDRRPTPRRCFWPTVTAARAVAAVRVPTTRAQHHLGRRPHHSKSRVQAIQGGPSLRPPREPSLCCASVEPTKPCPRCGALRLGRRRRPAYSGPTGGGSFPARRSRTRSPTCTGQSLPALGKSVCHADVVRLLTCAFSHAQRVVLPCFGRDGPWCSLVKFLRVPPLNDLAYWKSVFEHKLKGGDQAAYGNLRVSSAMRVAHGPGCRGRLLMPAPGRAKDGPPAEADVHPSDQPAPDQVHANQRCGVDPFAPAAMATGTRRRVWVTSGDRGLGVRWSAGVQASRWSRCRPSRSCSTRSS